MWYLLMNIILVSRSIRKTSSHKVSQNPMKVFIYLFTVMSHWGLSSGLSVLRRTLSEGKFYYINRYTDNTDIQMIIY